MAKCIFYKNENYEENFQSCFSQHIAMLMGEGTRIFIKASYISWLNHCGFSVFSIMGSNARQRLGRPRSKSSWVNPYVAGGFRCILALSYMVSFPSTNGEEALTANSNGPSTYAAL